MPRSFDHAFIFDLDGVITDTAELHLAAWRDLATSLGLDFDDSMGERLRGVSRMDSLELILARSTRQFNPAEKRAFADRKNLAYTQRLDEITEADLLPGALAALHAVRAAGWGLALASASKNAGAVLERLRIGNLFDHVVDANFVQRGKPDPEIFRSAAQVLNVPPGLCVGVEDAVAGVASIKAAGMFAVGVGLPEILQQADRVIPDLTHFHPAQYLQR